MKLESLQDVLGIDVDKLKSPEKTRLITRIKQLIKAEIKTEAGADESAKDLPYTAVSVVGNKYVELKFDISSKVGRVVDVDIDSRDTRGKNYMSGARAVRTIQEIVKDQKELING
jgi:hypothetical protein